VRSFRDEDASDCERFLGDDEIMRFIGDGNFRLEKTTALKMINWFLQTCANGLGTWAIEEKVTSKVIGNCHLSECQIAKSVEFGIALEKKFWRQGYATEVCRTLLHHGKHRLKINDIVAIVHCENFASKQLLKKLGYKFDRELKQHGILQELYIKACTPISKAESNSSNNPSDPQ
jgi:RimJ/RimL family protein N-acetyltransferase